MTATGERGERRGIHHAVSLEDLTAVAGLIGLVSATLAVAGVIATAAYLSAWDLPPVVIRIDPLAAALRSEAVIVQSLNLALIVYGLDALFRRLPRRALVRYGVIGIVAVVLVLEAAVSLYYGFIEPTLTVIGGVAILVAHYRGWVSRRMTGVAFVVVALLAGYQTGREDGLGVRTNAAYQTRVILSTRSPVGGLNGIDNGSGWTYDRLYLVFRDSAALYVSANDGSAVWLVPDSNITGVELSAPTVGR